MIPGALVRRVEESALRAILSDLVAAGFSVQVEEDGVVVLPWTAWDLDSVIAALQIGSGAGRSVSSILGALHFLEASSGRDVNNDYAVVIEEGALA